MSALKTYSKSFPIAMSPPLVSIIVNCLNGERFVNACLSSILDQSYSNIEIIFWDNNSTDSTLQRARAFNDHRLRIFSSSKTTKLAFARSQALQKATGSWIAFLDIDDLFYPYAIQHLVDALLKMPTSQFVFGRSLLFDSIDPSFSPPYSRHSLYPAIHVPLLPPLLAYLTSFVNPISFGACLYKKSTLLSISLPECANLCPDYYWHIFFLRNTSCVSVNKPLVMKRNHPAQASKSILPMYNEVLAIMRAYNLTHPSSSVLFAPISSYVLLCKSIKDLTLSTLLVFLVLLVINLPLALPVILVRLFVSPFSNYSRHLPSFRRTAISRS